MQPRVRLALILLIHGGLWASIVWAPIVVLAAAWCLRAPVLGVVGVAGCGIAAALLGALERGVRSGRRLAYGIVCLLMLGALAYHLFNAARTGGATAVFSLSRAAAYLLLIVIVARARP